MINGATEIIHGVPATHIDPLLLGESHGKDMLGYIVIAHQDEQGTCDILILEGSEITQCGRMNRDLRIPLSLDAVRMRIASERDRCLVYLFQASRESMDSFLATFRYEPCLKVQVDALTRRQLSALLESSGCQKGILEVDTFSGPLLSIDLFEFESVDQLLAFDSRLKKGRLLLYDTEHNKELLQHRQLPSGREDQPVVPVLIHRAARTAHNQEKSGNGKAADTEFSALIKKILDAPAPENPSPTAKDKGEPAPKAYITKRKDALGKKPPPDEPKPTTTQVIPDPKSSPAAPVAAPEAIKPEPASSLALNSAYIRLFERVLRSFRQQAFECFGGRLESVIDEAEKKVRFLTPELDLKNLSVATAPAVLDLMEAVIKMSSILKRSRLKAAALTLVADLYNKHYEILETQGVIDRVEQFYYQLKG